MIHKFVRIMCCSCGTDFDVPVYCGDRFCPVCSVARRERIRRRLEFLIGSVKFQTPYLLKHLTLTIKNQQNLPLMVKCLFDCFKKLRNTDSWKWHVKGGAFVIEVKGTPGSWHVHLHILIESRRYEWKDLLRLWMKISPGRGVWINNIPQAEGVWYLTKYVTKTEVLDCDKTVLNEALKGTRLFQPFGSWYAINITYKPPPKQCRKCDDPCFIILSDLFDEGFVTHEKDYDP